MWIQFIIAIVMMVASYMLAPKPKMKTNTLRPQEVMVPTVSAGSPIQVPFGLVTIKNPNVVWYGGQSSNKIYS